MRIENFWEKYEYFFFDFDGVLVDTVEIKADAFEQLFSQYGKDIALKVREHHLKHGGMSRFEKFKFYFENFLNRKITESQIKELSQKFSNIVFNKVIEAPFIRGAKEFLEKCYEYKKKCFVVSGTPEYEIKKIIKFKNLGKFFIEVKGSPENKSNNLQYLVKKYNVDINKSVFFGDAKSDFEAAKKNGIDFIGINYFDRSLGYENFSVFINKKLIQNKC